MQESQQPTGPEFFRRASFRQRVIAAIVFLAAASFFGFLWSAGRYQIVLWSSPCGFKERYALPCPTCEMTTSALAFAEGKIVEAFYIQPAAALLCCVAAVSAFLAFLIVVFGVYFGFLSRFFGEVKTRHIIFALLVIIAAGWAVTLARAVVASR